MATSIVVWLQQVQWYGANLNTGVRSQDDELAGRGERLCSAGAIVNCGSLCLVSFNINLQQLGRLYWL